MFHPVRCFCHPLHSHVFIFVSCLSLCLSPCAFLLSLFTLVFFPILSSLSLRFLGVHPLYSSPLSLSLCCLWFDVMYSFKLLYSVLFIHIYSSFPFLHSPVYFSLFLLHFLIPLATLFLLHDSFLPIPFFHPSSAFFHSLKLLPFISTYSLSYSTPQDPSLPFLSNTYTNSLLPYSYFSIVSLIKP